MENQTTGQPVPNQPNTQPVAAQPQAVSQSPVQSTPQPVYPVSHPSMPDGGGIAAAPQPTVAASGAVPAHGLQDAEGDKSYVLAVVLSHLFGGLGVDRFYLGYVGTGVAKLLTFGGFGLWALIDEIRLIFGGLRQRDGKYLRGYAEHSKMFKIIFMILLGLQFLIVLPLFFGLMLATMTGVQSKARDTEREVDIKAIYAQIEAYYGTEMRYPSEAEINSDVFRTLNFTGLDKEAYKSPEGTSYYFAKTPTRESYAYSASPIGCDNILVDCLGYALVAAKEDGTLFTKTNLN